MASDRRAMAGSKVPPPEQEQLPCPRCDSSNTKFCYYNNYNFSQPRHFCKSCRRYWTQGGTLRDIPVGGGTRKTTAKRPRTLPSPPLALAPGSFTSLLNASAAPSAFLALGGLGLGIAPGIWGFPELGYMGSDGTALMPGWHMEDHPDCFSSPALAISTTGPGHALN